MDGLLNMPSLFPSVTITLTFLSLISPLTCVQRHLQKNFRRTTYAADVPASCCTKALVQVTTEVGHRIYVSTSRGGGTKGQPLSSGSTSTSVTFHHFDLEISPRFGLRFYERGKSILYTTCVAPPCPYASGTLVVRTESTYLGLVPSDV